MATGVIVIKIKHKYYKSNSKSANEEESTMLSVIVWCHVEIKYCSVYLFKNPIWFDLGHSFELSQRLSVKMNAKDKAPDKGYFICSIRVIVSARLIVCTKPEPSQVVRKKFTWQDGDDSG